MEQNDITIEKRKFLKGTALLGAAAAGMTANLTQGGVAMAKTQ